MAGATTTTVDLILKELYLGPIREALTQGKVLYNELQKNSEDFSGRRAVIPINYSRNVGVGSVAESGTLPSAGYQKYKDAIYTLTYLYGRLNITGQTLKVTKNDAGAFARALEREINGLTRDFKNELNRIMNGDGTGSLTTITTGVNSATQTVGSTRFLFEDELITIGAQNATISSIASDTSIVLTGAVNTTTADIIIKQGASEATGIAGLVGSTGTVGGIASTNNLWWQSAVLSNSAVLRDMTLDLLQQVYRKVEERTNQAPSFLLSKHVLRDNYLKLLVADKRYVNKQDMDGGFSTLTYNDVPWMVDKDAVSNTVFAPTIDNMMVFQTGPVDWMNEDGDVLHRLVNIDGYEATLFYYWQCGVDNRRNHAKLTDLNE